MCPQKYSIQFLRSYPQNFVPLHHCVNGTALNKAHFTRDSCSCSLNGSWSVECRSICSRSRSISRSGLNLGHIGHCTCCLHLGITSFIAYKVHYYKLNRIVNQFIFKLVYFWQMSPKFGIYLSFCYYLNRMKILKITHNGQQSRVQCDDEVAEIIFSEDAGKNRCFLRSKRPSLIYLCLFKNLT